MTTYTDDQAREQFDSILNAARTGEVRIRTKDGGEFSLKRITAISSPLDVPGVDLNLTAAEIVAFVREGRER